MILLDTILVAEAMRPQPRARVTAWLDEQAAGSLCLAAVSLAALAGDVARLPVARQVDGFGVGLVEAIAMLFEGRVLAFDAQAARCYGEILREARRRHESVSRAHGLVAAVARSYGMPVATPDAGPYWVAGCEVISVGAG